MFMTLIANYCNCVCKYVFVPRSSVLLLVSVVNAVSPFAAYEFANYLLTYTHTHSSFNQMCTHSGMLVGVQASVSKCALASLDSSALFHRGCEPKALQKFKFKFEIKCCCSLFLLFKFEYLPFERLDNIWPLKSIRLHDSLASLR